MATPDAADAPPFLEALGAGVTVLAPEALGVEVTHVAATSGRRVVVSLAIPTTPGKAAEVARALGLALGAAPHQMALSRGAR